MEFFSMLGEIVSRNKIDLASGDADEKIAAAYARSCDGEGDREQVKAFWELLSTGVYPAAPLYESVRAFRKAGGFGGIAAAAERLSAEYEARGASYTVYAHFIWCFLRFFAEREGDEELLRLIPRPIAWEQTFAKSEGGMSEEGPSETPPRGSLSDFTVENGVLTRYTGASACVLLPLSVREIGGEAFAGKTSLRAVGAMGSVKLGAGAFRGCEKLAAAVFGRVEELGSGAFEDCGSLQTVTMDFAGSSLSDRAFFNCKKLSSFPFLGNVLSFGEGSLAHTDLTRFDFSRKFASIGANAFAEAAFPSGLRLDLRGCEAGTGAFCGARTIASLTVGPLSAPCSRALPPLFRETAEDFFAECTIGELNAESALEGGMFEDLPNAEKIVCSCTDGVIPAAAFKNCLAKRIEVRGKVTSVDGSAFEGCTALRTLSLMGAESLEGPLFTTCKELQRVELGAPLGQFSAQCVVGLARFEGFSVDPACPVFKSAGGSVFSADGTRLYFSAGEDLGGAAVVEPYAFRCTAEEFTVPAGVRISACGIDCSAVKKLIVPEGRLLEEGALFRVRSLSLLRVEGDYAGVFSTELSGVTVERLELDGFDASRLHALFREGATVFVSELYLKGGYDRAALQGMGRLKSLELVSCDVVPGMFDGVVFDRLILDMVGTIYANSFKSVRTMRVEIGSVERIESGAFTLTQVNDFSFAEGGRYRLENGVLYGKDELVYCFDRGICDLVLSPFVTRVCKGALDRLPELRTFTAHHAVTFEAGAVRECARLWEFNVGVCGISSFSEIFENGGAFVRKIIYSAKEIGSGFFAGLRNLSEFCAGDGLRIGDRAFEGDALLEKINLLSVSYIGDGAFRGCRTLGTAEVGPACSHIGAGAFEGCSSLKLLDFDVDRTAARTFAAVTDCSPACVRVRGGELPAGYFEDCGMTSLILDGVKRVRAGSVVRCDFLKEAVLKNVRAEKGAFRDTTVETLSAERVKIEGTAALSDLFAEGMPESVRRVEIGPAVSRGNFTDCTHVEEAVLLEGTNEIPDGYFENCAALRAVTVPASCRTVGSRAFKGCSALEEISLGASVVRIGKEAFWGCDRVLRATLPFVGTAAGRACTLSEMFGGTVALTQLAVLGGTVAEGCFEGFSALEKLSLSGQEELPDFALRGMTALRELEGTESVKKIGESAFEGDMSLVSLSFPNVTEVGARAFADCTGLSELTIGPRCAKLGADLALHTQIRVLETPLPSGCDLPMFGIAENSLKKVTLTRGKLTAETFSAQTALEEVDLPATAAKVPDGAFKNFKNLRSAGLANVLSVGESAFEGCALLKTADLRNAETIAANAFAEVPLTKLVLSERVKSIGDRAFAGSKLKNAELHFPATLAYVGRAVFENAESPVVHVVKEQTVQWDPEWDEGCRRRGLLWLSRKIKVVYDGK